MVCKYCNDNGVITKNNIRMVCRKCGKGWIDIFRNANVGEKSIKKYLKKDFNIEIESEKWIDKNNVIFLCGNNILEISDLCCMTVIRKKVCNGMIKYFDDIFSEGFERNNKIPNLNNYDYLFLLLGFEYIKFGGDNSMQSILLNKLLRDRERKNLKTILFYECEDVDFKNDFIKKYGLKNFNYLNRTFLEIKKF